MLARRAARQHGRPGRLGHRNERRGDRPAPTHGRVADARAGAAQGRHAPVCAVDGEEGDRGDVCAVGGAFAELDDSSELATLLGDVGDDAADAATTGSDGVGDLGDGADFDAEVFAVEAEPLTDAAVRLLFAAPGPLGTYAARPKVEVNKGLGDTGAAGCCLPPVVFRLCRDQLGVSLRPRGPKDPQFLRFGPGRYPVAGTVSLDMELYVAGGRAGGPRRVRVHRPRRHPPALAARGGPAGPEPARAFPGRRSPAQPRASAAGA